VLERFLQWMGLGLCHQLPERSFFGGGVQVPVCARDTGIYLGFVAAFCLVALLHRGERPTGFPHWRVWVVMGLYLGAMGIDGVSSYAGLRVTSNELRLLTGLGVGIAAATVVYPMLQDELWRRANAIRLLDPLYRFWAWVALLPAMYAVVWCGGPFLGVGYPLLVAACIVFTLAAINLVIVGLLPPFDRRSDQLGQLWLPVLIAIAISFVEIAGAAALRVLLEGLV